MSEFNVGDIVKLAWRKLAGNDEKGSSSTPGEAFSPIEKRMEKGLVVPVFVNKWGLSPPEARKLFREFLQDVKQELEKSGVSHPPNYGDLLLQQENNDLKIKSFLDARRKEGVTDEDIRRWWNMDALERGVWRHLNNHYSMNTMLNSFEKFKHLGEKAALEKAQESFRRSQPVFGDPEAPPSNPRAQGSDRPLPEELEHRIDQYIEKRMKSDFPQLIKESASFTSFNAFVRSEIAKGRL